VDFDKIRVWNSEKGGVMLLKFSVENWASFCDEAEFSAIASREKQHSTRIPHIAKYDAKVLPIAAIYGGNASGKTNFFKALHFAKLLIVSGTQPEALIPIESFRFDDRKRTESPCVFAFELLAKDTIYEYSFAVTRKEVVEEKCVQISSHSEKTLFHRKSGEISFDKSLVDNKELQFVYKGTRDNQLFLTNSVSQKMEFFKPIYDWFKHTLELVAPDTRFGPFEQFLEEGHFLYNMMNRLLPQLDTGIDHIGSEEIPFSSVPIPEPIKYKLQAELPEGGAARFLTATTQKVIISRKNGELVAKKLVAFHKKIDGTLVKFEMWEESDGSLRVIELLPAFLEVSAKNAAKVYIVDELDRSLHTLLTRKLLELFLKSCSKESRSQLLFTTHDLLLMDQDLLRRDEMWLMERKDEGKSHLISFSDFKDVRYDKDVRKSYLQGRLGGIPNLGNLQ
jgi:AAA15 family ATPase/GTPase